MDSILNIIKAARFERTLIPLSYIIIQIAYAKRITPDINFLKISCIFTYATGGLINAKMDNDFQTKYINKTILLFLLIALSFSLKNYIITLTILIGFIMGYIYSKPARKILFGDGIILPITHILIPIISSSLILKVPLMEIIPLTLALMIPFGTMLQMKNLKGINQDKKNNYKTLMTCYKNGRLITYYLLKLSFIIIFLIYFLFDFGNNYLAIVLILYIIQIIMDYFIYTKQELKAHGLTRLITITIPLAIVLEKNPKFATISLTFSLIYIIYYIYKIKKMNKNGS